MHERVKAAWDFLCRDPRQDDKGTVRVVLSTREFRRLLKDRDEKLWLEYAEGLKFRVFKDDAMADGLIKVVVGNLFTVMPMNPDNIDLFREATGRWQVSGWWKEKNTCSPKMMKPR